MIERPVSHWMQNEAEEYRRHERRRTRNTWLLIAAMWLAAVGVGLWAASIALSLPSATGEPQHPTSTAVQERQHHAG